MTLRWSDFRQQRRQAASQHPHGEEINAEAPGSKGAEEAETRESRELTRKILNMRTQRDAEKKGHPL